MAKKSSVDWTKRSHRITVYALTGLTALVSLGMLTSIIPIVTKGVEGTGVVTNIFNPPYKATKVSSNDEWTLVGKTPTAQAGRMFTQKGYRNPSRYTIGSTVPVVWFEDHAVIDTKRTMVKWSVITAVIAAFLALIGFETIMVNRRQAKHSAHRKSRLRLSF